MHGVPKRAAVHAERPQPDEMRLIYPAGGAQPGPADRLAAAVAHRAADLLDLLPAAITPAHPAHTAPAALGRKKAVQGGPYPAVEPVQGLPLDAGSPGICAAARSDSLRSCLVGVLFCGLAPLRKAPSNSIAVIVTQQGSSAQYKWRGRSAAPWG